VRVVWRVTRSPFVLHMEGELSSMKGRVVSSMKGRVVSSMKGRAVSTGR
jgi:hypothetical protein